MRNSATIASFVVVLVAGCATKEPEILAKPAPGAPARVPDASAKPSGQPEVYSRLAGRKIKPIAVKPITVKADCSFRDPTGYGGRLGLVVQESRVQHLQAELQVPKRGTCAFALKDFRQIAKEPSVTLASASSKCTVRLWEQEGRVTVAFNGCHDRCGGDSFDYVWPILVDARTGSCG